MSKKQKGGESSATPGRKKGHNWSTVDARTQAIHKAANDAISIADDANYEGTKWAGKQNHKKTIKLKKARTIGKTAYGAGDTYEGITRPMGSVINRFNNKLFSGQIDKDKAASLLKAAKSEILGKSYGSGIRAFLEFALIGTGRTGGARGKITRSDDSTFDLLD